ncbi:hypothetical protein KIF24_02050 [Micromonospora sp. Llam7]|uniref:hypothetical protein n=1 Tax=Micromonospora tarapacensis TaxID=2835305 RepID=UPI001C82C6E9|nr:hypothetical protein [Micromonospora tarapacensis]MBX7264957.1 hypothetical protein [Micromonospora tarapacensis]
MTIDAAAKAATVGPVTWRNIEVGERAKAWTLEKVDRQLGWPPGSLERYIRGDDTALTGIDSAGGTSSVDDVDLVLSLDLPDTTKVILIRAVRSGGEPLDAILAMDLADADKVTAIQALRELFTQRSAATPARSA